MEGKLATEPVEGYYFDQLEIGQIFTTPRVTVTEDAIIRFALEWDPQPFHIDRLAAKQSIFGQLVASGLQTILLTSRLFYDAGILRGTAVAGVGFDNARFLKPLFPGDTIGVKSTVIEKAQSSKAGRGKVRLLMETVNQNDEVIYRSTLIVYVANLP